MLWAKSVTLVFENCEHISIPIQNIGQFYMDNIRTVVGRYAVNSIAKALLADSIKIEIFSEADIRYDPFGDSSSETDTIFKRLQRWNDITSIEIVYDDGTEEVYYTDYDGEEVNPNQKSYLSSLGNLYIVIDSKREIKDCFDLDYINDRQAIQSAKDMQHLHNGE